MSLVVGLILGAVASASQSVGWYGLATAFEPVGTLWTNAIRMTVIPLVVALLVTGVAATADPKRLGRIGSVAVPVFLGLLLAGGAFAVLLAPLSLLALALGLGARLGVAAAGALLHYVLTLSAVLLAFTLLLYPVARVFGGVPLGRFAAAAIPAQAVAFSSRSSLAALPALVRGARDRLHAPPTATGFALPLAVSVFRLNVPIAWVVGALFLAKLYGVDLDLPQLVGLVVTATLISFSVPGIPSASLFLLALVLVDLGLPAAGAGLLIAVDAIPDMFKTTVNVTSRLAVATIAGRSER
ncbi:MAG TPA: cation:dicarboxylase symporter family transporter [Gemmatimonadales bacterium]